ncbi:hypothetical protein [Brumimicrobium mesophilum]|uniref:hypothetical protein n=1 Tax=Brumimicrobium mesophilum TaxID=392717 RepID=UPI00131AA18E|nr:hypothetical protein [Brumimicrobium mesophilum]
MKLFTTLFISTLVHLGFTQNLVSNPSFENRTDDFCGIMHLTDFDATAEDWYSPTQSTPDLYFTTINPTCYNYMPNSSYSGPITLKGSQLPRTGEVMAGLMLYSLAGLSQREYLQILLDSPLNIGETYVVECYVSLGDNMEFATNGMGMYLSTQPISLTSDGVLNYSPQITSSNVISETQNWVLLSDTITATEAHTYVTIGNFNSDAQTTTIPNQTSSTTFYGSYYYVDDVNISSTRTLNTAENSINKKRELVKIIDFMGRETEFKPNTPLIYIYNDGTRERVFQSE